MCIRQDPFARLNSNNRPTAMDLLRDALPNSSIRLSSLIDRTQTNPRASLLQPAATTQPATTNQPSRPATTSQPNTTTTTSQPSRPASQPTNTQPNTTTNTSQPSRPVSQPTTNQPTTSQPPTNNTNQPATRPGTPVSTTPPTETVIDEPPFAAPSTEPNTGTSTGVPNNITNNATADNSTNATGPITWFLPDWDRQETIPGSISDIGKQTLRALDQCMKAVNQTSQAIAAAAEATAVCEASVDCSKLENQYNQTTQLIVIAAEANNHAQAKVNSTLDAVSEVAKLIQQAREELPDNDKLYAGVAAYCADIVKMVEFQARLAAEATANASAKCRIIVNMTCFDCPRRPSNFTHYLAKVKEIEGKCDAKAPIPNSFYIPGTNTIRIKSSGSNYLTCRDGQIQLSNNLDSYWIPTTVGQRIVALKHTSGGYLQIQENGDVDCSATSSCDPKSNFYVSWSSNQCEKNPPNYISLRNLNGRYLSIDESGDLITSKQDIYSENELFKGYNYNDIC
jgi:hypothetical protein